MIHIVDYGLGNVQALLTSFKRLGVEAVRARSAAELNDAKKLILPGVGAFDTAMRQLNESGMRDVLDNLVMDKKIPILGICVGMQMMAESSEEGSLKGLGWIPGHVCHFKSESKFSDWPLPHMGWNDVAPVHKSELFLGMESELKFYFLHSYFFKVVSDLHIAAVANYGVDFTCSVSSENVYGVQFHPEKSHHFGSHLLKNFSDL